MPVKSFIVRLMLVLSIAMSSIAAAASTAAADSITSEADAASSGSVCGNATFEAQLLDAYASNLLPVDRWSDAMTFHYRLPFNMNPGTWLANTNANQVSTGLSAGNAGWQASTFMTKQATRFCVGDTAYLMVDTAVGTIGKALTSSNLLLAAVVFSFIGALVAFNRRGILPLRQWAVLIAAAVMLGTMTTGATKSTAAGGFGMWSPGWITQQVNKGMDSLATGPLAALNKVATDTVNDAAGNSWQDAQAQSITHCRSYTEALRRTYRNNADEVGATGTMSSVPVSLDAMWTESGMATWQRIQFSGNPYAAKAGCHLLEYFSNAQAHNDAGTGRIDVLRNMPAGGGMETTAINPTDGGKELSIDALAFNASGDVQVDQAMIGWAACTLSADGQVGVDEAWTKIEKPVTVQDCKDFFFSARKGIKDGTWDPNGSTLNFTDNVDEVKKRTANSPEVADYVLALHGNLMGNAMATSIVYAMSSWILAAVFLVLGGIVWIAKLALLFFGLFALFQLIKAMFTAGRDLDDLVTLGKRYLLMAAAAVATTGLLSLVAFMTSLVQQLNLVAGVSGTLGASLITGLSPVVSVVLLHLMFTRVLKVASPFTPSGAKTYAKMATDPNTLSREGLADFRTGMASRFGRKATETLTNRTTANLRTSGGTAQRGLSQRVGGMNAAKTMASAGLGAMAGSKIADSMSKASTAKKIREQSVRPDGVLPKGKDLATLAMDADSAKQADEWAKRGGQAPADRTSKEGRAADNKLLRDNRSAYLKQQAGLKASAVKDRMNLASRLGEWTDEARTRPGRAMKQSLKGIGAVGAGLTVGTIAAPLAGPAAGVAAGALAARYASRKFGVGRGADEAKFKKATGISRGEFERRKMMVGNQVAREQQLNRLVQQQTNEDLDKASREQWQDQRAEERWGHLPSTSEVPGRPQPVGPVAQPRDAAPSSPVTPPMVEVTGPAPTLGGPSSEPTVQVTGPAPTMGRGPEPTVQVTGPAPSMGDAGGRPSGGRPHMPTSDDQLREAVERGGMTFTGGGDRGQAPDLPKPPKAQQHADVVFKDHKVTIGDGAVLNGQVITEPVQGDVSFTPAQTPDRDIDWGRVEPQKQTGLGDSEGRGRR